MVGASCHDGDGARSTEPKPETIPVSGGMADTLCKDGGISGLESELGDGEGWVVLKNGDEAEGEGDGEARGAIWEHLP